MRTLFLFLSILFCTSLNAALNVDSLKQLLNTNIDDTTRIKIKIDIGQVTSIFRISYWDSLQTDCERVLNRSNFIPEQEITTHFYSAVCNNTGYLYKFYGDIESAEKYYKKSIKLNLKLKNTTDPELKKLALQDLAQTLNNWAVIITDKGNNQKGLELYEFAYKVKLFVDDKEGAALTLNNMGYVASNFGEVERGMEYYFKSLAIREEIGDKAGIGQSYTNIGVAYADQKDYEEALNYHRQALNIYQEIKQESSIARAYNNIGTNYMEFNQLDSCEYYYLKAYEIRKSVNAKSDIANSLQNLGFLAAKKNNFTQAIDYYKKSLSIYEELEHKLQICQLHQYLSGVYVKIEDNTKALQYSQKAYQLAKELNNPEKIAATTKINYLINKSNKKFEDALAMFETHIEMRDSITNAKNKKALIKQMFKHNYEKQKTLDDAAHEKQLTAEKEAKAKQKIISIAAGLGLGLVIIFLIFVFNRLQVTRKQKNIIETQKQKVEKAHHELAEKNQEITDSINYAKRIQTALLTSDEYWQEISKEHFVFFKPKDVVSGDFFWAFQTENNLAIWVAADCTGHGVPGAFMSMLGIGFLNEIVVENNITNPVEILNSLREKIIKALEQKGVETQQKDGMDLALCVWDKNNNTLEYSGANNPLWLVRDVKNITENQKQERGSYIEEGAKKGLVEYKADKQPVGFYREAHERKSFTSTKIQLHKGDTIYTFSDGFADQFGGEKGKKYKYRPFKKLLISINSEPLGQQKQILDNEFKNWKGDLEQIDDVCIIGVRI